LITLLKRRMKGQVKAKKDENEVLVK